METDGRIRSKDIGTGEVNSRVIDDLRSSNYDGSHTDPENDPGLNGWQILKSGFMVINNAVVRGTIAAARIVSAIISGGEVNITEGGKLTVGGDPDTGVAPLVTLDETGLDIGGGLTVIDSTGVQVGTDVVMDSTGLHLDGGDARAIDIASGEASAFGTVTLTSTFAQKAGFTVDVPTWANSVVSFCWASIHIDNGGFGTLGVQASARIDDVDDGAEQSDTNGLRTQTFHMTEKVLTTFGSTVEFSVYGKRNGGSGDPTGGTAAVRGLAIFLR